MKAMRKALLEVHAPIGRSDPQAVFLANSLSLSGWQVRLIQCLHPNISYVQPEGLLSPDVELISFAPLTPMWAKSATFEFSFYCASLIRDWNPDIFVAYDFSGQLAIALAFELGKLKSRCIVMQLESVDYTRRFFEGDSLGVIGKAWRHSLVVYPECNRLISDAQYMAGKGFQAGRFALLAPTVPEISAAHSRRNPSRSTEKEEGCRIHTIAYTGSIVKESYVMEMLQAIRNIELLSPNNLRVVVAGPISSELSGAFHAIIQDMRNAEYLGVLNQEGVTHVLEMSDFSFIGWKPLDTNFFYCAPNKFFQALAHGCIPICVPSPIFITASHCFPDLNIAYLNWNSESWDMELQSVVESIGKNLQNMIKVNSDVFAMNLSWDVEFRRFYDEHLSG